MKYQPAAGEGWPPSLPEHQQMLGPGFTLQLLTEITTPSVESSQKLEGFAPVVDTNIGILIN